MREAILNDIFRQFSVDAEVVGVRTGPAVSRYEVRLGRGTRIKELRQLKEEVVRIIGDENVDIISPLENGLVGIEIPNKEKNKVDFWELEEQVRKQTWPFSSLVFGVGVNVEGKAIMADLMKLPHLLIAGATGSGKSVFINTMLASLIKNYTPETLGLVLIDPKRVEMLDYRGLPHLKYPVVSDANDAPKALDFVIREMEQRYELMSARGFKNVVEYNTAVIAGTIQDKAIVPWVVVIDELADLMIVARKQVESSIVRIAQLARASGIHLVVATQRPSVNVITGLIKANMPSRLSFAVTSKTDSRVILDTNGAESLSGHGDGLFMPQGISKPIRIQAPWIEASSLKSLIDSYPKVQAENKDTLDPKLVEIAYNLAQTYQYASAQLFEEYLNVDPITADALMYVLRKEGVIY
jgi:DNA segregation ATPase FtsK/SpoIIIE, S-DNA-T family